MTLHTLLALIALAASVMLLLPARDRLLPTVAVAVSGVDLLMALGAVHLSVSGLSLGLVLGGVLATVAGLLWLRAHGKTSVAAATCAALVGGLQVLGALHIVR